MVELIGLGAGLGLLLLAVLVVGCMLLVAVWILNNED
jgi:hypothetical protein